MFENKLLGYRFTAAIRVYMVSDRKVRQRLVSIHDFLPAKHDIMRADINEPAHAVLKASIQDVAGSVYVYFIDTPILKHLFARHSIRGKVENTISPL